MQFGTLLAAGARRPASTVNASPDVFATDWSERPDEEVCIGLCLVSEQDVLFARSEAGKRAVECAPDRDAMVETYNDTLMRMVVARSACDPNDASLPWFRGGEDSTFAALTPEGTKYLYDAYERLVIERSPNTSPATDEQIANLAELALTKLPTMDAVRATRVRRLLAWCVTELTESDDDGG